MKTEEYSDMVNTVEKFLTDTIKTAMANPPRVKQATDVQTGAGHYVIMSNKPVPKGADVQSEELVFEGKYVWYNGTKVGNTRGRIKDHLFRSADKRVKPGMSNGIRVEQYPLANLVEKTQNYKVTPEGNAVWQLGIDITEKQWSDYEFYVVVIPCEGFWLGAFEQAFREEIGLPPLVKARAR